MSKKDEKLENGTVTENVENGAVTENVEVPNVPNGEFELSQPIKVETLKSTLVKIEPIELEDGREIIAAIIKEGRLNTKNTIRSYLVALSGPELAVQTARDLLNINELSCISGAEITWERTSYAPGSIVSIAGESRFVQDGLVVDHIIDVDLSPIKTSLFMNYLEMREISELSPLMERVLLKGFDLDLN